MIFATAVFIQILAMMFLAVLVFFIKDKLDELDVSKVSEKEAQSLFIQLYIWAGLWGSTWVMSIILFFIT